LQFCIGITFCVFHANEYHGSANWYHFFEQWRNTEYGSLFVEYDRGTIVLPKRCLCSATFFDAKKIIVQTLYGKWCKSFSLSLFFLYIYINLFSVQVSNMLL